MVVFTLFSCNSQETKQEEKSGQSNESFSGNANTPPHEPPGILENVLLTDSLNIPARLKLAGIYYSIGNTGKALDHYFFILRHDENNQEAIVNVGNLYYDLHKYQEAIPYYERYLKTDKNNIGVRCDLATCYLNIDDIPKAGSLLKENLRINPNHPQSHYNLSVLLSRTGKQQEADAEMKIFTSLTSGQR